MMSTWSERFFRALHDFYRMRARLTNHISPPLPPGEFFFLERLSDARYGDGMRLSALRDKDHMSPPAVSQMLRALERKGLIERSASKEDRRHTLVTVTPQGREIVNAARQAMDVRMDEVIARYGEDRAKKLTEMLEELNLVIAGMIQDGKNEVKEP